MNTHDILAYAVATEAVRRVRAGLMPWNSLFSADSFITASRAWPVPDFVLVDNGNKLTVAAEFKPPQQTKREYLTGLGQAVSYSRNFNYAVLVLPTIADDGYPIAKHIVDVLQQPALGGVPVGVLSYDPAILAPHAPGFSELHFFTARGSSPAKAASLDQSFYAKWREISPEEAFQYIAHTYDEMRSPSATTSTIRDRAFARLWTDIQAGKLHHWAGGVRHYGTTVTIRTGVLKNYRNFLFHLGWTETSGALTSDGLRALHVGSQYGAWSRPFMDEIAKAALSNGKHLILFNAISEYQDSLTPPFPTEAPWLAGLEAYLATKGLLKRNPQRAAAAVAGSARAFLKAEKQFWRNLELIVPRGSRVFHPGRGLIFNWSRITELLQAPG